MIPERLEREGYTFAYPTLNETLTDILKNEK
ncbi:hypothetical protein CR194_09525 [Salipaludibacillus keqinensis]|uniref:DUF1731 domain-containing protein n=1 Tax=Salipaludibacillus keqinensis TaxID=2045207 RepID=A0A323TEB7_9BACI|nr:DUF1731 domain-containing protein [Salipaludibacillus keqinensis]PYZ93408.1 hypothetical protein CR194_09525 [Salipaludibacillus keqinensis]